MLWKDEELNRNARAYVTENANPKGRPNMTALSFCAWVNDDLLPNHTLPPGFPQRISIPTAQKWQHELGFDVLNTQGKSMYIDGHEREDVVEYRKVLLAEIGFLNKGNAPTPEAANYITYSSHTEQQKNTVIFHDESIFTVNDDQKTQWGTKDMLVIKPKGKGSGIMVSDFVDEHNGYLCFVDCDGRNMKHGFEGVWS